MAAGTLSSQQCTTTPKHCTLYVHVRTKNGSFPLTVYDQGRPRGGQIGRMVEDSWDSRLHVPGSYTRTVKTNLILVWREPCMDRCVWRCQVSLWNRSKAMNLSILVSIGMQCLPGRTTWTRFNCIKWWFISCSVYVTIPYTPMYM